MAMRNDIAIRAASVSDIDAMVEISRDSIIPPWTEGNFSDALDNNLCKVFVGVRGGTVCGYLVCYHAADEGEIPSVAVAGNHRRRGVAASMIKEMFSILRGEGIRRIFLEVREHNEPAVGLYESLGFLRVGMRKNFYDNPIEDAVIMMRDIDA